MVFFMMPERRAPDPLLIELHGDFREFRGSILRFLDDQKERDDAQRERDKGYSAIFTRHSNRIRKLEDWALWQRAAIVLGPVGGLAGIWAAIKAAAAASVSVAIK